MFSYKYSCIFICLLVIQNWIIGVDGETDTDAALFQQLSTPQIVSDFNNLFSIFADKGNPFQIPYNKIPHFICLLQEPLAFKKSKNDNELRNIIDNLSLPVDNNGYVNKIDLYTSLIKKKVDQQKDFKPEKIEKIHSINTHIEMQKINVEHPRIVSRSFDHDLLLYN